MPFVMPVYINSGFFEPLIQTTVYIAQNSRIELKNNNSKKKIDSDHFWQKNFIKKSFFEI